MRMKEKGGIERERERAGEKEKEKFRPSKRVNRMALTLRARESNIL